MGNNRIYIGRRNLLGKYLSLEARLGHLLITPSKAEVTRRFWLHLLQREAEQCCSSIVFTHNPDVVERIEAMTADSKVFMRLKPNHPDSLSLNPLFHSDQLSPEWLADFFFGKEEARGNDLNARKILKALIEIAINDPGKEATLPGIYRQVGLGLRALKEWLRFQKSPLHLALLEQINLLSNNDQAEVLREIYTRFSFFQETRIEALFSRPTAYAPIYHHEPSVLIVCLPMEIPESRRLLQLAFLSIAHQLLSYPPGRRPLPLYFHLEEIDPLPADLFPALTERQVGLTCLAERSEGREGYGIEIRIAEGISELIREGGEALAFHPALEKSAVSSQHQ